MTTTARFYGGPWDGQKRALATAPARFYVNTPGEITNDWYEVGVIEANTVYPVPVQLHIYVRVFRQGLGRGQAIEPEIAVYEYLKKEED